MSGCVLGVNEGDRRVALRADGQYIHYFWVGGVCPC